MNQKYILGNRIRNFRKRSGMSQMELEIEIEASPGSISRIENGEVNPTKETLTKIGNSLNLNNRELDYLSGPLTFPANDKEIDLVKAEVKDHLSKPGVLAYVIDDRWRLLAWSDSMQRLLGITNQQSARMYKVSLIKCMLDKNLPLFKLIDNSKLENTLYLQLSRVYQELSYMIDDEAMQQAMASIENNEVSKRIWMQITNEGPVKVLPAESREVFFTLGPVEISMHYSRESIHKFPRFEIIEYFPTNVVIELLSKLI